MDHTDTAFHGSGAHLDMRGSRFRSKRDIKITNVNVKQNQDPIEILMKHVALGALANSSDRYDPPKCHPNTRVAVLDSIDRWIRGRGSSRPILWLCGPLGAGKSAIAQTLAEGWEESNPAATFFLSRTAPQRNQKECIIPTIAYQLTLLIPELRPLVGQAILQDRGLFNKDLRTQMRELIIRPLSEAHSESTKTVQVILVDGLDECCEDLPGQDHEAQQREILEAVAFAAQQPGVPLRFLVASRPERQIIASFNRTPLADLTHKIVLDNLHNPKADIGLFLSCKFESTREEHPYIDSSWPSEDDVSELIEKSSGHFVYASVVVRQLEQPRQDPRETLQGILGIQASRNTGVSPFAELDALYLHVLRRVSAKSLPFVTSVFQLLCFGTTYVKQVFSSWEYYSPASIEKYFFIPQGQIYIHLADLNSVLHIPLYPDSTTTPIQFIHASFGEFLTDPSRSGSFFLDAADAWLHLQSVRLRHCYIENLNGYSRNRPSPVPPGGGVPRKGYFEEAFRVGMEWGLGLPGPLAVRPIPFDKELAERIAALMGTNEVEYFKHVNDLGLSALHAGGNRRAFPSAHVSDPHYRDRVYTCLCRYLKACGLALKKYGLEEPTYNHQISKWRRMLLPTA